MVSKFKWSIPLCCTDLHLDFLIAGKIASINDKYLNGYGIHNDNDRHQQI